MKNCIVLLLMIILSRSLFSQDSLEVFYDTNYVITLKEFASFERIWKTNEVYEGAFTDININRHKICEGTYKNNNKEGVFKYYYPDNQVSSQGLYSNNEKSGKWIYYYKDGSIKYEIEFSSGSFHVIESVDSIGNKLIIDGSGIFQYEFCDSSKNVLKVSGVFKNYKMTDEWTLSFQDKILVKELYEDGNFIKGTRYDINLDGIKIKTPVISTWIFEPFNQQIIENNYFSSLLYREDYPFLIFIPERPDSSYFRTISASGYGIINNENILDIEQPRYPGGEEAFKELYSLNILREAINSQINEGKFVVQFDVDCFGIPRDFKVIRAPSINMEKVTIASFDNIRKWSPGKYNGQPINVRLTYNLKFKLVIN